MLILWLLKNTWNEKQWNLKFLNWNEQANACSDFLLGGKFETFSTNTTFENPLKDTTFYLVKVGF